jgi:hypothetical protein
MAMSGIGAPPEAEQFSVFVGDLTPEVSDFVLMESFRQFYPSVTSAKVRAAGPGPPHGDCRRL